MKRSLHLKEKELLQKVVPNLQPDNWLLTKKMPTQWRLENKKSGKKKVVSLRSS